jgi:hypothetical protein
VPSPFRASGRSPSTRQGVGSFPVRSSDLVLFVVSAMESVVARGS